MTSLSSNILKTTAGTMTVPAVQDTNDPVPASGNGLNGAGLFDALAAIPVVSVWLTIFTSSGTRMSYRRSIGHFIATMNIDGPEVLYHISQSHVIAYREHLNASGVSQATIASRLSALSSLYRFLIKRQLCSVNPVSGVMRPKIGNPDTGNKKPLAFTPQQVRAMLDAPDAGTLEGLRDRAILRVYFHTGGHYFEPHSLRVRDFRRGDKSWVLELTIKGGKTRTVVIPTECRTALWQYLNVAGHGHDQDAGLFQAVRGGKKNGAPLSRQRFEKIFKRYALMAGVDSRITPHSARRLRTIPCTPRAGERECRSVR